MTYALIVRWATNLAWRWVNTVYVFASEEDANIFGKQLLNTHRKVIGFDVAPIGKLTALKVQP